MWKLFITCWDCSIFWCGERQSTTLASFLVFAFLLATADQILPSQLNESPPGLHSPRRPTDHDASLQNLDFDSECQWLKSRGSDENSGIQICSLNSHPDSEEPDIIDMANKYAEVRISDESEESEDEEMGHYVPRVRSPLARAMYSRMLDDRRHRGQEHTEWYAVDTSFYPEDIKSKFVQCYQDQGTLDFLDNCYEKSDWVLTQLYHGFMKSCLTWFMSVTSANAFLGRGSMFVFSRDQFRRLMRIDRDFRAQSLIDLGAGDGKVTAMMADHYTDVFATEVSTWMQSRLREAGYTVLTIEEWSERRYDLIGCLNLLDRCERPLTLLNDIRRSLNPGGVVIVALVLPYVPYVENVKGHKPLERLPIKGRTFSEQVLSAIQDLFIPNGFEVISFTHLPYLCEGDIYRSFYVLNDAVFVLKLLDS